MNDISLGKLERDREDFLYKVLQYTSKHPMRYDYPERQNREEDRDVLGKKIFDLISDKKSTSIFILEEEVSALIVKGANLDYKDEKKGDTSLIVSIRKGYLDIAAILIRAGASVDLANNYMTTPLMVAARHGYSEMVEALILLGANVNAQCKDGDTALISAKRHGQQGCFDVLVKYQANLLLKNWNGESALTITNVEGNKIIIDSSLLDDNVIDSKGQLVDTQTPQEILEQAKKEADAIYPSFELENDNIFINNKDVKKLIR